MGLGKGSLGLSKGWGYRDQPRSQRKLQVVVHGAEGRRAPAG